MHEELPGVSQSLRSFFLGTFLTSEIPSILPVHVTVSMGKESKTHTKLYHNFPGKAKCYNVFFSQHIYVCITVFTELQHVSCWPTECIILLPTSHFKMTTLATSRKFAYFRLLLRKSKIASSKTAIHPRMDTSGIEYWTASEPILRHWNQPECFDCAYIFETFKTEGLEMVPDSSEIPDFLPVVMQWLCMKMLTLMNLLIWYEWYDSENWVL